MTDGERRTVQAGLPSALRRLKHCTSPEGAISPQDFAREAERLGLTTEEQRNGFREGLAELGIHVDAAGQGHTNHQPALGPSMETGGLSEARRMLTRYADADGTVSRLARDGVVHLHQLGVAEARVLDGEFMIDGPATPRASPGPIGSPEASSFPDMPAPASTVIPGEASATTTRERAAMPGESVRLADAVRAAREVLEADRWRRNPSKTVLKADEGRAGECRATWRVWASGWSRSDGLTPAGERASRPARRGCPPPSASRTTRSRPGLRNRNAPGRP